MKQNNLIVFLGLFVVLVQCGSDSPISPRNPPPIVTNILESPKIYGLLKVSSVPNDAAIYIDGIDFGKKTPFSFNKMDTGKHVIIVKIDGYKSMPDSIELIVAKGKRIGAHFDLIVQ